MAEPETPAQPETADLNFWNCRALGPGGVPAWVALAQSAQHADGVVVELPQDLAREEVRESALCFARLSSGGEVKGLEVTERAAPKAPPLWFAELKEPSASPPATNLLAFTGHGIEPGTLLDRIRLREVEVTSTDQLAAFRWYPSSGFVDQVYVAPQWRRRTIGSAILYTAGALRFARGWPRLWSDGQRTADGEGMRAAGGWAHLTQELTHLRPPMTPS